MKLSYARPTNHLGYVDGGCDWEGGDVGMGSTRKQIKVAFLGHSGFCLAPELHAEVDLAANTSAYHLFRLFHKLNMGEMGDGAYSL